MDKTQLWKAVLGELNISASPVDVKTFFPQTSAESFEDNILTLACKSPIVKERVENRYYNQIRKIAQKIVHKSVEVSIIVKPFVTVIQDENIGPLFTEKKEDSKTDLNQKRAESGLSNKYTFDNFIVGSNNKLAHTIAQAVAASPGKAYNPFFIYSGVGLGKTHLIQAIGNYILEKFPNIKVLYCASESFTNELVESLMGNRAKSNKVTQFRNKFRKTDVLLIDDVQFIAGKESTQEEFFNAFNALYMDGKQIIITSDRPPSEIQKLEKRLSSRFASGMIADMQMPDSDTRMAILREKRNLLRLNIPDAVCDFIAQNTETNIRELEGVFTQIVIKTQTLGKPFTIEAVSEILGKDTKRKTINPTEIVRSVATYYSVKLVDIRGARRVKEVVYPRHIAMYLIRNLTSASLTDIGNLFGGKDHSTVFHATEKIKEEAKTNSKLQQDISNIKVSFGNP